MKVNIIYPQLKSRDKIKKNAFLILKILVVVLSLASVIVNLCVKGKAWSAIVVFSSIMVFRFILTPDLVEQTLISTITSLNAYICILLVLIAILIAPGWEAFVVPIVCASCLFLSSILFFVDVKKYKNSSFSIVFTSLASLGTSFWGYFNYSGKEKLSFGIMGIISSIIILSTIITLRKDFLREIKRRFHTN